jgi:hypothetical protein
MLLLTSATISTSAFSAAQQGNLYRGKPKMLDEKIAPSLRGETLTVLVGTSPNFGLGASSSSQQEIEEVANSLGLVINREKSDALASKCDWSIAGAQLPDPAKEIAQRIQHGLENAYGMIPITPEGEPAATGGSNGYAVSVQTIGWQAYSFNVFTDLGFTYIAKMSVVDNSRKQSITEATCAFWDRHASTQKPYVRNYFRDGMAPLKTDLANAVEFCASSFLKQSLRVSGDAALSPSASASPLPAASSVPPAPR